MSAVTPLSIPARVLRERSLLAADAQYDQRLSSRS